VGKEKPEKRGKGKVILNLVIIAILIGVAIYMFSQFGGSCGMFKIP
jgi:hypothetical protein